MKKFSPEKELEIIRKYIIKQFKILGIIQLYH